MAEEANIIWYNPGESIPSGSSGVYGLPSFQEYQDVIAKNTAANNAWSAEQAQKQMDFQERMSSTAHQREVADLQAAGLNPVLSAGGSGAAALSGAQANPDQSGNSALTTFLVNLVQAQNQMEMTRINAENALATASMYNATSELVSRISAGASNFAASTSAAASRYAADQALVRQQQEQTWTESHPTTWAGLASSILNGTVRGLTGMNASEALSSLWSSIWKIGKTEREKTNSGTNVPSIDEIRRMIG